MTEIEAIIEQIVEVHKRQSEVHGRTPEHDDTHTDQELARFAALLAMPASYRFPALVDHLRPWSDLNLPDPHSEAERIRELVKAAAVILAEIIRIRRALATKRRLPPMPDNLR